MTSPNARPPLTNPYVLPTLLFPDMDEPDPDIENLAKRKGVYVIWGAENLLSDLAEIVRSRSASDRLTAERIAAEVLAVTDGQIRLEAATERETGSRPAPPPVLSIQGGWPQRAAGRGAGDAPADSEQPSTGLSEQDTLNHGHGLTAAQFVRRWQ